jgi:hypothetical protein
MANMESNDSQKAEKKKQKGTKLTLGELSQALAHVESPPTPTAVVASSYSSTSATTTTTKWSEVEIELPSAPTGESRRGYMSGFGSSAPGPPFPSSSSSSSSSSQYPTVNSGYQRTAEYHTDGHRPGRGPRDVRQPSHHHQQQQQHPGFFPDRKSGGFERESPFGNMQRPGRGPPMGNSETRIDLSTPAKHVDFGSIPSTGPYIAYLGNLPHKLLHANGDVTELQSALHTLLPKLALTGIVVPLDKETGLPRGFAYATVASTQDLIGLLECDGRMILLGRPVHVDVAAPRDHPQSRGGRPPYQPERVPEMDWRSTAKPLVVAAAAASDPFSSSSKVAFKSTDKQIEREEAGWRSTAKPTAAEAPTHEADERRRFAIKDGPRADDFGKQPPDSGAKRSAFGFGKPARRP